MARTMISQSRPVTVSPIQAHGRLGSPRPTTFAPSESARDTVTDPHQGDATGQAAAEAAAGPAGTAQRAAETAAPAGAAARHRRRGGLRLRRDQRRRQPRTGYGQALRGGLGQPGL